MFRNMFMPLNPHSPSRELNSGKCSDPHSIPLLIFDRYKSKLNSKCNLSVYANKV